MGDDQIDRNIKFAQSVADAYGYQMVAAALIYDAFENHSGLNNRGFMQVSPGMFCREIVTSLIHVVKLQALKGGAYMPCWGVSLGFMPHAWKPKAKFHPSLKASRLDLFERPKPIKRTRRELWEVGSISSLHGEEYMRATLRSMWSDYEATIVDWFAQATDFESCLEVARLQVASEDWSYGTHFPSPKLVHAFLLAKLGRVGEAKSELARYCTDHKDDTSLPELERALEMAE
jgi:hypothetical protein